MRRLLDTHMSYTAHTHVYSLLTIHAYLMCAYMYACYRELGLKIDLSEAPVRLKCQLTGQLLREAVELPCCRQVYMMSLTLCMQYSMCNDITPYLYAQRW